MQLNFPSEKKNIQTQNYCVLGWNVWAAILMKALQDSATGRDMEIWGTGRDGSDTYFKAMDMMS